jgi:hypothetical protein
LAASLAVIAMTGVAHAQYTPALAIDNPDLEVSNDRIVQEGRNLFVQFDFDGTSGGGEGWSQFENSSNGGPVRLWGPGDPVAMGAAQTAWENGDVGAVDSTYIRSDDGMGGVDGSGNADGAVLFVQTPYNDDRTAFPGVRDFEAATQILTETFDPTAKYVLTARTGNPVHSQYYDWATHPNPRGVTIAGDDDEYNGYDLQIAAGGVHDHGTARYAHHTIGGTVVASNPGSVAAGNVWETATTTLLPNPSTQAAHDALAGEVLQIRLAALEDPLDHSTNSAAVFDDITLSRYFAGDADEDGDIDNSDIGAVAGAFTGSGGTDQTWATGDFDGDGDVDNADIGVTAGAFTGAGAGNLIPSPNIADLIYDPVTGNLTLDPSQAAGGIITSFQFESNGEFLDANYNPVFGGFFQDVSASVMADSDLTFVGFDDLQNLGNVLPTGLDLVGLESLLRTAVYTGALGSGQQEIDLRLAAIPEPGSMAMLALGCLLINSRRRRAA